MKAELFHTIAEGQIFLLFLPPQSPFPIDGIRFQEQEVKYTIPLGNNRVSSLFGSEPYFMSWLTSEE